MSVNPYAPSAMPEALPSTVIQSLVERLITPSPPMPQGLPGTQPGGPVAAPPPMPAGAAPGAPAAPGGPPQPQQAPGPPPGPQERPGQPEDQNDGLSDDQAKAMTALLANPKVRSQVDQLTRKAGQSQASSSATDIDPVRKLNLAQHWNSRIASLALALNTARSPSPGASKASDEALLRVWYMTPIAPWAPDDAPFPIPLADIDEYADAVRVHLVQAGWTDVDKIEDQTLRECFPLRETLIKAGRDWRGQVAFTDEMLTLTERWLKKYGRLPFPDLKVLATTREGKGDPESQARDTDSSAYPPGGPPPPMGMPK